MSSDKFKHSATNKSKSRGQPRKGGGGGKFVWGSAEAVARESVKQLQGSSQGRKPSLNVSSRSSKYDFLQDDWYDDDEDFNDDSYASVEVKLVEIPVSLSPSEQTKEEFSTSLTSLAKFKETIRAAIRDFFADFDREAFLDTLNVTSKAVYHQQIPKLLIAESLDKDDDTRFKVHLLLQHLVEHSFLSARQLEMGVRDVVSRIEDLSLDNPKAQQHLNAFLSFAGSAELLKDAVVRELKTSLALSKETERGVVKKTKEAFINLAKEYFESSDLSELELGLRQINQPVLHYEFVKQIISLSFDRTNRERELVSFLICSLADSTVSLAHIERAFEILLQRVEDLAFDVPHILEYLSLFIARAIVDEALSPSFLATVNLMETDLGFQVVLQASLVLKPKYASERMAEAWGERERGIRERSVLELRDKVKEAVEDYFASGDAAEASRAILALNCRFFHHEFVKCVFFVALSQKREKHATANQEKAVYLALQLLNSMLKVGTLSAAQLRMGVRQVKDRLADILIDVPKANEVIDAICTDLSVKV